MRGFLLDTNILLWAFQNNPRLSPEARRILEEQRRLFVSAVTVWEIAIKVALGKLVLAQDPVAIARSADCAELPITWKHAEAVARLPLHHRDPFDRLLVAQALVEDLVLLTSDRQLAHYPIRTVF